MQIKFDGEPKNLVGQQPEVGQKAPDAQVVNEAGDKVQLKDLLAGQRTILSVVPDITTSVCSLQTQRFAKGTAESDIQYLTISRNQQEDFTEWKSQHDLDIRTLTDDTQEFGQAYGLEIEGMEILARAVFVVDAEGEIVYRQIVPEATHEPKYDEAIAAARA